MGPIPDVAWGLLWAKYFTYQKQFQFVGYDALRSRSDRYGNTWSLKPLPNLQGLSDEHREMFIGLAETFGYDPENPPKDDYILLHCHPQKGAYDIASQNIEKSQEAYRKAQKHVWDASKAIESARERNRPDLVDQAMRLHDEHKIDAEQAAKMFQECKAVIENAVQRFYLVPMEAFEKMDFYGMPIQCQPATILPQKRHQSLPEFEPPKDPVVM